jgi:sulfate adenylyltransferase subunit 1
MDVLKIATAGSVDDGKSSLIGRLLYETESIPTDKFIAIEQASKRRGLDFTDLSLLTDGLIAEREQGITIDVAHIYFSTPTRRFIIADSPGHVEYTRNMITGASGATVSVILVDASRTITEQTKRHLYLSTLLRMQKIIVCVNKMDLVDWSEERFLSLEESLKLYLTSIGHQSSGTQFIPVSSLLGENVSSRSGAMDWYNGPTLLEVLEELPTKENRIRPLRFQVQQVLRANNNTFRGYAGKVKSGKITVGDAIQIHPSGKQSTIKSIQKHKEQFTQVSAGESIVITLEDDIDASRGDMIILSDDSANGNREINAKICWLAENPLNPLQAYTFQHGSALLRAKVTELHGLVNVEDGSSRPKDKLTLNEIADVTLKVSQPVLIDPYNENPSNGSFILIDPITKSTVAVGLKS